MRHRGIVKTNLEPEIEVNQSRNVEVEPINSTTLKLNDIFRSAKVE